MFILKPPRSGPWRSLPQESQAQTLGPWALSLCFLLPPIVLLGSPQPQAMGPALYASGRVARTAPEVQGTAEGSVLPLLRKLSLQIFLRYRLPHSLVSLETLRVRGPQRGQ